MRTPEEYAADNEREARVMIESIEREWKERYPNMEWMFAPVNHLLFSKNVRLLIEDHFRKAGHEIRRRKVLDGQYADGLWIRALKAKRS